MKRILGTLVLAACVALSAQAQYENTTIKIGQKAPDLSLPNPEGKTLKLSEINKGSYVIVDFWASWCRPCRMANPGLVKMNSEYAGKKFKNAKNGMKILNVSLDQNKDAWVNAIKQDGLTWPNHISDLGGWGSGAAALYGVQYIPQAFLIDPNGKVIGKYGAAEEAENDLKNLLAN